MDCTVLGPLLSKGLRWGFCIPSSCTSEHLAVGLSEYLGNNSGVSVSVSNTDCHSDDVKPYTSIDRAAVIFFFLLVSAILLSTGYEFLKGYTKRWGYWYSAGSLPSSTASSESSFGSFGLFVPPATASQTLPQNVARPAALQRTGSIVDVPCTNDVGTSSSRPQSLYVTQSQAGSRPGSRPPSRNGSRTSSEAGSRPPSPAQLQAESRLLSLDLPTGAHPRSRESSRSSAESLTPSPWEIEKGLAPEGRISEIMKEGTASVALHDVTPTGEYMDVEIDPWTSFSLISNGRKIFSFEDSNVRLQSVYGLKFLSICWVLIGQTYFITDSLPAINHVNIKDYSSRWFAMPLLNASLSVDTFIVITGVLLSFNFLRDMRRRGIYRRSCDRLSRTGLTKRFFLPYLPMYYLHRQVRLAPSLAVLVLFQVSLLDHLGSGPFWNSGNGYLTQVCRKNWVGTLTYLQNYIRADEICVAHSWYVMVDMQLYIFSPLILIFLLAWNKRRSLITIGILVSMGITCSFFVNYFLELPVGLMSGDPSKWSLKNRFDHVAAYTRFAPWMIGIGVGYLLYCYRRKGKIQLEMSPFIVLVGWLLTMLALGMITFVRFPFQEANHKYNVIWSSLYSSMHHTIWALGVGWIIIACESSNGGIIQTVLSWKIFQPLSRLTFCIYLVHLPLMTSRALMTRVPIHFSGVNSVSSFFGDTLFSTLLAILLSLSVELPLIRLFRYLTMRVGIAVRQTPSLDGSEFQSVPLLRHVVFASYHAIASGLSRRSYQQLAPTASGASRQVRTQTGPHLETIAEIHLQPNNPVINEYEIHHEVVNQNVIRFEVTNKNEIHRGEANRNEIDQPTTSGDKASNSEAPSKVH